ncbi:endonuclease/exonuclease/phosphatase family protein [Flavobacterium sediminilitoris]|uniref:Endonuclease/exonuclease/phosphatase family protein n=1 Tax=Flavobacterium sediminilitoris TaxID=2024526 RepID=A0ABY4HHR5_9FLAO|nr:MULTISPECIES: endonuclease/exonuclease/phosphatase family protein [Flavobacterium]UOX32275.1 endonuclease/exonuclease/phosphatase family protein [Flavobacterium sediminilitoris]
MKKESWISRLAFFVNKVLAILTFLAYILPFLAPKLFPFLSVLTLLLPLFLIVNFIFFIVWVLQLKRKALLSGFVLLIGITFINKLYRFSETNEKAESNDFTLMSYNVRLFNKYEWLPNKKVPSDISDVIQNYNPDILCLQEYTPNENVRLRNFPFKNIELEGNKNKYGQAIFSKYEIINTGEIDFPNSSNNVIFADIVKFKDTIRVYSMHLQSIKISTDIHEKLDENKSKFIFMRISEAFKEQQLQSELIKAHYDSCKYPKIICGDLNNSAFSYVYRNIKGEMNDAFEEAGSGFGKSYNFKYYPARIDYVFVEDIFKVKEFQTNNQVKLSDHFPVITRLEIVEKESKK